MTESRSKVIGATSARERLGGRWAISLPPYMWSIPFMVGIAPLAVATPSDGWNAIATLYAFTIAGWIAFGAVLFIGHRTYFKNRASTPVHPAATVLIGALAGLARSIASGDWFAIFGRFGNHSPSLVINGTLTGIVWIVITASFMDSKHSFIEARNELILEQQRLLSSSENWLEDVREKRYQLADEIRQQLRIEWEQSHQLIREKLSRNPDEWNNVLVDLASATQETVKSLATTMNRKTSQKAGIREGLKLIAQVPFFSGTGPAIAIVVIGILPLSRLVDVHSAIVMLFVATIFLVGIPVVARKAIHRFPAKSEAIYRSALAFLAAIVLLSAPVLQSSGLAPNVTWSLVGLGALLVPALYIAFGFISVNRNLRNQELKSLQQQNVLLESLDLIRAHQDFVSRTDIAAYINITMSSALKSAHNTIEQGIALRDLDAVNNGLAILDVVYSNVLGRYEEDADIDLRNELERLTKPWSQQTIITWNLHVEKLDRELSRRVLLIVGQCLSHLLPTAIAQRVHCEITGQSHNVTLDFESNVDPSWIDSAELTRNALNAATTSWNISSTTSGSRLHVDIYQRDV